MTQSIPRPPDKDLMEDALGGIERSFLRLTASMVAFCAQIPGRGTGPYHSPDRLKLRHAPRTPAMEEVFYADKPPANCGLSIVGSHVLCQQDVAPASRHAELRLAAVRMDMMAALEAFRHSLCEVPALAHDSLQIDISTRQRSVDKANLFRLSIDGVALSSDHTSVDDQVTRICSTCASLAEIPIRSGSRTRFFIVQDHLVCAPGPGVAWMKLQTLVGGKAAPMPSTQTPAPTIVQIILAGEISDDFRGMHAGK